MVRSVDGNQKLINVIIKSNGVNLWSIIIKKATNFRATINHAGPKQERFRTNELYNGFIGASRPKAIPLLLLLSKSEFVKIFASLGL